MIWSRPRVDYPTAGNMFCPRKRSGSMPAGRGTTTAYSWGNDINSSRANYNWDGDRLGMILNKPAMWVSIPPTRGAFMTCREMSGSGSTTGKRTILPVPKPILRSPSGSSRRLRVDPGTTSGRSYVLLAQPQRPQLPRPQPWLPCRFQAMPADTANPELKLLGGAAINREARPSLGGARGRGPRSGGRKYHRSDRGHGNGGYEQHGNLFTHLHGTGRRRQHRHHHPHGHGDGCTLGRSECHRGDGYDLVSARHFYDG